jgi:hypothetical protein
MRWLEASKTFRALFYLNNDQSSSNDHAWAVASTLGHSNPSSVSLKSYVHCLDLWLSLALESMASSGGEVGDEQLRKLSGLPHSTAHTRLRSTKNEEPQRRRELQSEFTLALFRERFGLSVLKHQDASTEFNFDAK